jgi:hypothetical protein
MFWVNELRSDRRNKICSFFNDKDIAISVLLAAADFEWTCRRAIIALGSRPNADIRESLKRCSGLDKYKEHWKNEVFPGKGKRLTEIIDQWSEFKKAYNLRNVLIHGSKGTTGHNH